MVKQTNEYKLTSFFRTCNFTQIPIREIQKGKKEMKNKNVDQV